MDPPKKSKKSLDADAAASTTYKAGAGVVRRKGGHVWCATHESHALVSVVEREGPGGAVRYVQWCSLIDLDDCSQQCLCQPPERDDDES